MICEACILRGLREIELFSNSQTIQAPNAGRNFVIWNPKNRYFSRQNGTPCTHTPAHTDSSMSLDEEKIRNSFSPEYLVILQASRPWLTVYIDERCNRYSTAWTYIISRLSIECVASRLVWSGLLDCENDVLKLMIYYISLDLYSVSCKSGSIQLNV